MLWKGADRSGGVLLIPEEFCTGPKHIAIAAGKDGRMFLLDRDNLGRFHSDHDQEVGVVKIGKCWCGQTYFRGSDDGARVVSSGGDTLSVWRLTGDPVLRS
jgi:hypothetical protein